MNKIVWLLGAAALLLSACDTTIDAQPGQSGQFLNELPEGVLAIVASHQDLSAVKIDPTDGCYVYRYVGPVETTFLPLRSHEGRPICTRPSSPVT